MKWYYALGREQKGPVNSTQLRALAANGAIGQSTLVWREEMPGWQPYASVVEEVESTSQPGEGEVADMAVCAYSGEVRPRDEMLEYGDRWVAADHKEAFVASLQQGSTLIAGERMTTMVFVGFWWRVLASTIDFLIKLVPNMIFSIPYFIVQIKGTMETAAGGANPQEVADAMGQWTALSVVLYLLSVVGSVGFSIFYETWMVGKYGGTVGKLAFGFRIVRADGTPLTYLAAFGRWWAETLTKFITIVLGYGAMIVVALVFGFGAAAAFSGSSEPPDLASFIGMVIGMGVAAVVGFVLGGFGYWMAGITEEKKALHDIICSTRVVRKL